MIVPEFRILGDAADNCQESNSFPLLRFIEQPGEISHSRNGEEHFVYRHILLWIRCNVGFISSLRLVSQKYLNNCFS